MHFVTLFFTFSRCSQGTQALYCDAHMKAKVESHKQQHLKLRFCTHGGNVLGSYSSSSRFAADGTGHGYFDLASEDGGCECIQ
mmetsp:Transcript_2429/g.6054  ORF Transcript_2429/g.6054 Transcript_2429/m.6054 type:complete len:83 (+) Transcript_2429:127-375(+)